MPDAADELRQSRVSFRLKQAFHHRPTIDRLIWKSGSGEHPAADGTKTCLKPSQLGDH
jgi:hypothetical protein